MSLTELLQEPLLNWIGIYGFRWRNHDGPLCLLLFVKYSTKRRLYRAIVLVTLLQAYTDEPVQGRED